MSDILVDFKKFILKLPIDLRDELSEYFKQSPLVLLIFSGSCLNTSYINEIFLQLEHDYTNNKLSEDLKNAIVAALMELK